MGTRWRHCNRNSRAGPGWQFTPWKHHYRDHLCREAGMGSDRDQGWRKAAPGGEFSSRSQSRATRTAACPLAHTSLPFQGSSHPRNDGHRGQHCRKGVMLLLPIHASQHSSRGLGGTNRPQQALGTTAGRTVLRCEGKSPALCGLYPVPGSQVWEPRRLPALPWGCRGEHMGPFSWEHKNPGLC